MLTGDKEPLVESTVETGSVILTDLTTKWSLKTHRLLLLLLQILALLLKLPPLKKTSLKLLADDNRRSEMTLIPSDFNIDICADRFIVAIEIGFSEETVECKDARREKERERGGTLEAVCETNEKRGVLLC